MPFAESGLQEAAMPTVKAAGVWVLLLGHGVINVQLDLEFVRLQLQVCGWWVWRWRRISILKCCAPLRVLWRTF